MVAASSSIVSTDWPKGKERSRVKVFLARCYLKEIHSPGILGISDWLEEIEGLRKKEVVIMVTLHSALWEFHKY